MFAGKMKTDVLTVAGFGAPFGIAGILWPVVSLSSLKLITSSSLADIQELSGG